MQAKYMTYAIAVSGFIGAALCAVVPLMASAQSVTAPVSASTSTATSTALNWSGYVSEGGTYTQVSGTWVVPTVTATGGTSADATWVGIGGVLSRDLIQAGTEAVPDANGTIDYEAWYELLPAGSQTVPLAVHPGDSISVSIREDGSASNEWLITFADNTTGATYATSVEYDSSLSSAEWIEEMPAGVGLRVSLDDFGTVSFADGSTVENGATETIAGSDAEALTMQNDLGEPTAVPSALGADGASFTVERTSAASSSMGIGAPHYARMRTMFSYGGANAYAGMPRLRVLVEPNGQFRIQLL